MIDFFIVGHSLCIGVWERVFQHLANDADNEYAMIDSTIVRAHFSQRGGKGGEPQSEAIGRSKGGLNTKIHATMDAPGNFVSFHLTPGQTSNLEGADQLLSDVVVDTGFGDKKYDVSERVIEPRRNRKSLRE